VLSAERTARRSGIVRVAASAKQLHKPGPRQAMIDAIDLALMHHCTPAVYRWEPRPALTDAA
jgi:predicted deacetylase